MRKAFSLFAILMMLVGLVPELGWAAKEGAAPSPEAAAAEKEAEGQERLGRGEGFETKAEEAKEGVECPATFGPIIAETAVPIDKGKFAVQPTFGLSFTNHVLSQNWRRVSARGNFNSFIMTWKLVYGLWDNLEVFTVIPYIHNWAYDVDFPASNGSRAASSGGLGDVVLTFKYRLVEESKTVPTVTAQFTNTFPSGRFRRANPDKFGVDVIGGGANIFTTGLNLSKCLNPFVLYANAWYSMQTAFTNRGLDEEGNGINVRNYPRDFVTFNLAAEYVVMPKWVALLEVLSTWDGGRLFGHKANVPAAALVSVVPGIEYIATEKLSFALGCQFDLAGKNTTANITPLFSLVYTF